MEKLVGILSPGACLTREALKRFFLLLDTLGIMDLNGVLRDMPQLIGPGVFDDLDFLQSNGLVHDMHSSSPMEHALKIRELVKICVDNPFLADLLTREAIRNVSIGDACLVVPICQQPLPESLSPVRKQLIASTHELAIPKIELTLRVALERLPIPDGHCAWEDILVFKTEMHDKQWAFRRFLKDLATKRQSAAEIGDDIEWSMNEYKKAMAIHRIKSTQSFVEVFVISPLEIIENLVKFNWSKIAKGMLEVQKRKVELLESEQKAPGRECAYVFDARRRFGGS